MNRIKLNVTLVGTLALSLGFATNAQANPFVSFEDAGSKGLSDNQSITDQYSDLGFSFGIDNDLDGIADSGIVPALEKVGGGDRTAGFVNSGKGNDVAEAGYFDEANGVTYADRLGNYFLRTGGLGGNGGNLLISYANGTSAASGELWDIDGNANFNHKDGGPKRDRTELWEVQALSKTGDILETLTSPLGTRHNGELDGKPWLWSFERESADIGAIRFVFTGDSPAKNVGLAFDNFSAYSVEGSDAAVPEPTTILGGLLALGGGALAKKRRDR
ncbi:MAG: PEP-CTERM sorting domain-containing protein [Spirulinaceae cyanobacterium]